MDANISILNDISQKDILDEEVEQVEGLIMAKIKN